MNTKIKIVADSSADLNTLDEVMFASAPLKIVKADKEYIDDADLDVRKMCEELAAYVGKVSTACPSPGEWIKAFGDAEYVIALSISGQLSGSYNSLLSAKEIYESDHPDRHVFGFDSINAGPGMNLLVSKLKELIISGKSYEEICKEIDEYKHHVGIIFCLNSLHNFANNGRVNPIVAKAVSLLNIRVVGKGSPIGELKIIGKAHGEKKAIISVMENLKKEGCAGKRIRIGHVFNFDAAVNFKNKILEIWPDATVDIYQLRGLCSFYAQDGGVLIAFEK